MDAEARVAAVQAAFPEMHALICEEDFRFPSPQRNRDAPGAPVGATVAGNPDGSPRPHPGPAGRIEQVLQGQL